MLGTATKSPVSSTTDTDQIAAGSRRHCASAATPVVGQLGKPDRFNADPAIHIPLPKSFKSVQQRQAARHVTLLRPRTEVEPGRQQATPKAKALFMSAIEGMTLDDVMGIYQGPQDAATRYFQKKMAPQLAGEMNRSSTRLDTGRRVARPTTRSWGNTNGPLCSDVKADLSAMWSNRG